MQKIIVTSIRLIWHPGTSTCSEIFSWQGKRYADVDAIEKASTAILNAIPKADLKNSFDNLLDRANRCIRAKGTICLQKKPYFFYKVLELLNSFLYV